MTASEAAATEEVAPEAIMRLNFTYVGERCMTAGVQLGVFSAIAAGAKSRQEIARATEASERGIRMLLDTLVAIRLLTKAGAAYELTAEAERYLVAERPDYMGGMMELDSIWQGWSKLTEVVKSGRPLVKVEEKAPAEKFFSVLVRWLHVMNREAARKTAALMTAGAGAGAREAGIAVLDVACGSGVWGIALAEADPAARVTFQDYPGVLEVTREYAARHGVEDRVEYLAGNLKEVDFGEERYDVALLGNIVHSEGERSSRDLFGRLHRALRPGGRIVVIDMIPNDERTGSVFALGFALNMLLHTEAGDTYTLAEYTEWLKEAGFGRVETEDVGSDSPLIIGIKD